MPRSSSLKQIEQEIAALQREAAKILETEKAGVIGRIKEAIDHYGLTEEDLGFGAATKGRRRGAPKVAKKGSAGSKSKFRDDAGHTWSGHGRRPRWYLEALANGKTEADPLA